ncbi:TRAP transporter small permease [Pseudogemmobacter sonorensis]|uniref:TRAP transporter small permease n=1 Tax=Pseudogemmobacter sonorensis TaxID=2989681 RepID=UPI0036C2DDBA
MSTPRPDTSGRDGATDATTTGGAVEHGGRPAATGAERPEFGRPESGRERRPAATGGGQPAVGGGGQPDALFRRALGFLDRIAGGLAAFCARLSGAVLLALTGMLLADVVGRGFGRPLFGAQDLAEMGMVVVTFGALAMLDHRGGQIRVDLFAGAMPGWMRRGGDRLSAALGAAIWLALAWALWDAARLSALLNLSSNILSISKAPFQHALAAFAVIAALGGILRAILPERPRHG